MWRFTYLLHIEYVGTDVGLGIRIFKAKHYLRYFTLSHQRCLTVNSTTGLISYIHKPKHCGAQFAACSQMENC